MWVWGVMALPHSVLYWFCSPCHLLLGPKKSYVSHPVHIKSPRSVIDYANKNHDLFDRIEFVKILQLNNQRCRDDKITFRSINCQEWLGVWWVKRKRWSWQNCKKSIRISFPYLGNKQKSIFSLSGAGDIHLSIWQ